MLRSSYNEPFVVGLAERIRTERHKAGWTQAELAERAGLSWISVAELESGKQRNPKLRTIRRLARALGVSYDRLIPPPDETL